jgi:Sec-independent protein translocase protein TatA
VLGIGPTELLVLLVMVLLLVGGLFALRAFFRR